MFLAYGFSTTVPSLACTVLLAKCYCVVTVAMFCSSITIITTSQAMLGCTDLSLVGFFFFKQKTAYEIGQCLEFRRVLFRSRLDARHGVRRVVFSGFGIGDPHQLVNSITHGPDGSLWFTEGLHAMSRVETPWGISRLDRAAVWRMRPRELRLDGFFGGGMAGANCWGVAFDDFGQVFHKSGDRPHGYWTVPGMVRWAKPVGSGAAISADASYADSPEQYHSVGPLFETSPKTTALDLIGTRALPEDIQGCALIAGYFGAVVELHRFTDAGSGFKTRQLPKLMKSSTSSFRPVDVSVGPDGAIYVADWF